MPDVAGRRQTMPYRAGAGIRRHMTQVAAVAGSIDVVPRRAFRGRIWQPLTDALLPTSADAFNPMLNDTCSASSRHANSATNTPPRRTRGLN